MIQCLNESQIFVWCLLNFMQMGSKKSRKNDFKSFTLSLLCINPNFIYTSSEAGGLGVKIPKKHCCVFLPDRR